ncbi:hypothetical protein E3E22_10525 [Thermococcus sp. MV5]|uniref:hypothetical protein n=1 Tax=Thermococcus sp. MV5 TaxID=1638272 RepID=UPI001438B5CA|nr:hypothetical protein [Thermococcus sp. MV5]NJE27035.1 hypothetical protein [Thermococcus sp. MV5]
MVRLVGIGSRVSEEVYERICGEAKAKNTTRSEIIRHHLTKYYELIEKVEWLERMYNACMQDRKELMEENERLKTKVKTLERLLELQREIEKQKEKERKNRLWRWMKEHILL